MVKNNSRFDIGSVVVKHNYNNESNNMTHSPDAGVYIEVTSGAWGAVGYAGLGVSEAREIAKALNKIADEVEARKSVEKTISQKLSELPNGTVLGYGSNISSAEEYHKIGDKFFHKDGHTGYQASSFRALRAWVNGKEL